MIVARDRQEGDSCSWRLARREGTVDPWRSGKKPRGGNTIGSRGDLSMVFSGRGDIKTLVRSKEDENEGRELGEV